jgi:hypothetical protein
MPSITLTQPSLQKYDALRKNQFVISFNALTDVDGMQEGLTLACHSATLPKITTERKELHYMNDRAYVPGKPEFDTIDFSFYEYVGDDPQSFSEKNAGSILKSWQNKIYNPQTGIMSPKKSISTSLFIYQISGDGTIQRRWNVYGAWPTSVEYDELDSENTADVMSVKTTISFDWAKIDNIV